GDCSLDQTWLMANPESLIHVAPATGPGPDGMQISGRHPANSAVNVAFAGVMPPATRPLPVEGDSTPTAVVFVGHFNDGRADLCSGDGAIACHRRLDASAF